jgi:hypothetical protein
MQISSNTQIHSPKSQRKIIEQQNKRNNPTVVNANQTACSLESNAKFKMAGPATVVESSAIPPSFVITQNTNPNRLLGIVTLLPFSMGTNTDAPRPEMNAARALLRPWAL